MKKGYIIGRAYLLPYPDLENIKTMIANFNCGIPMNSIEILKLAPTLSQQRMRIVTIKINLVAVTINIY
jgi:hypothetical protein